MKGTVSMALIKCPECGKEVSDKAKVCINCGFPLEEEKSELTVFGLTQELIGGTMKLFLNGQPIGKVGKGEKITVPITSDCELTAKCGINPAKGKYSVKAGKKTVVRIKYNRMTGGFIISEDENMMTI